MTGSHCSLGVSPSPTAACRAYGWPCRAVASVEHELSPSAVLAFLMVRPHSSISGLPCTEHIVCMFTGETPLLPGSYSLVVVYSGDSVYAAASVSTPYAVDTLCLLQVLHLAV